MSQLPVKRALFPNSPEEPTAKKPTNKENSDEELLRGLEFEELLDFKDELVHSSNECTLQHRIESLERRVSLLEEWVSR